MSAHTHMVDEERPALIHFRKLEGCPRRSLTEGGKGEKVGKEVWRALVDASAGPTRP